MNRDQKAAVIERIAAQIEESEAVFAVDYRGITVKQAVDLRTSLTTAGASFQVVKNTLTERAAERAGAEPLKALLQGPTALAFVRGDVALAAKALATFRRQAGALEFKGGQMNGQELSAEELEALARLPARDVLQAQFVGVLASPLTTLVRGLASLIGGLAVALREVEQRGLVGGSAAPAADGASEAPGDAAAEAAAAEPEPESAGEAAAAEPAADAAAAEQPSEAPADPAAEAEAAEAESEAAPTAGADTAQQEG